MRVYACLCVLWSVTENQPPLPVAARSQATQFSNTTTPLGTLGLIVAFFVGEICPSANLTDGGREMRLPRLSRDPPNHHIVCGFMLGGTCEIDQDG